VLLLPAYLLGTFPSAGLVGRWAGQDPTQAGSGNPGASNAYRTMGRRAGALVLVGDVCKGALAAGGGLVLGGRGIGVVCGLAAVVGHVLPATRRFRGGKGVATAAGMSAVLLPVPTLALALLWALVAKVTATASIASIVIAVAMPGAAAIAGRPPRELVAFGACGALVVMRHRSNIDRLRRGEERTLARGRLDADLP